MKSGVSYSTGDYIVCCAGGTTAVKLGSFLAVLCLLSVIIRGGSRDAGVRILDDRKEQYPIKLGEKQTIFQGLQHVL